jgi:predicted nucleic acid-binding protein
MMPTNKVKLRVFIDADVLFAGSAGGSEHGASLVILRMAEITLIEALTSEQVMTEVERNLGQKIPQALPNFYYLISRCLKIVPDPEKSELAFHSGKADVKDLPILAAAQREDCPWLVSFNVRHFQPGAANVTVLRPGDFLSRIRDILVRLT